MISDMLVDIVAEGVDVAIRVAELQDSSLVARKLAVDKRVFCAAPGYLAANGTPQTPDDLRLHNCLTYNLPGDAHDWVVQEEGKPRTIRLRGRFETNSSIALHQAAVAGLGIARLATFLVGPDIRAGRLVQVLPHVVTTEAPIYAVYPHRRHLSPKVRAFVNYMVEQFTPVPPWDR